MANYEKLKTAIAEVIKENGNQEITGKILQNTLLSMVNELGGNATFAGVATPETNPGTPDGNVFYLVGTPGTYANFNGIEVGEELAVISNESGSWVKKTFYDTIYSLRKLYETAGAKYNEKTGFYELNGLTDITEDQMLVIYRDSYMGMRITDRTAIYENSGMRTNFPMIVIGGYRYVPSHAMFTGCSKLEVAAVPVENGLYYPSEISYAFRDCAKLKQILGILRLDTLTYKRLSAMFSGCVALEKVFLRGLSSDLSLADSPLISLDSLQNMVSQSSATSPITITVHEDVYAKIQDEGQADWHALIAAGQAKNITFATA